MPWHWPVGHLHAVAAQAAGGLWGPRTAPTSCVSGAGGAPGLLGGVARYQRVAGSLYGCRYCRLQSYSACSSCSSHPPLAARVIPGPRVRAAAGSVPCAGQRGRSAVSPGQYVLHTGGVRNAAADLSHARVLSSCVRCSWSSVCCSCWGPFLYQVRCSGRGCVHSAPRLYGSPW